MVDKLQAIINSLSAEKGQILLAALVRDESNPTWALILAAEWIDQMSVSYALNFIVSRLQKTLSTDELSMLGRVNFIRSSSPLIDQLARHFPRENWGSRLGEYNWGNQIIDEIIVIKAERAHNQKVGALINKNPIFNSRYNPFINSGLNPNLNSRINPAINGRLNPNINGRLNPTINGKLNPNINGKLNPAINGRLNPNINGRLNPTINGRVNPSINPAYKTDVFYNRQLQRNQYAVQADNDFKLFFNTLNQWVSYEIKVNEDYANIFNNRGNWIGYVISARADYGNFFDTNGRWQGFIVREPIEA